MRVLAIIAILPAAASLYFFVFWTGFEFFRRHAALALGMMLGTIAAAAVAVTVLRDPLLAPALAMPAAVQVLGWLLVVVTFVFGWVADRQLGIYVRAFLPLFTDDEQIDLRTTGAYAVVRHPIYASGIFFPLGVFLVTGHLAVAAATLIFALGALWFTRQEERRLIPRLADPAAYARYRARVPALFPFPRPRH
jgi:protein-S-isoprenylcysteine O-methyltransferase Ste14